MLYLLSETTNRFRLRLSDMSDMKFFRYLPVDDKHHPKGEQHGADGKIADYIVMLQWGILGRLEDNEPRNNGSKPS